jgi:CRP-like cAMP-binding protein
MKTSYAPDALYEQNYMLGHLPSSEMETLRPHIQRIDLEIKQHLNDPGTRIRHIYFPIDCAISLMNLQSNGQTVEVAVVGREGCTGFNIMPSSIYAPCRTLVQVGGVALRTSVSSVLSQFDRLPYLRSAMTRFGAVMFRAAVISVGCSQFHSVEERLARWLLAHEHRTARHSFRFTHDFLSDQLGVQRATVTESLANLQSRGVVKYRYGNVELLDISSLQKLSCDCFGLVKDAIDVYYADIRNA